MKIEYKSSVQTITSHMMCLGEIGRIEWRFRA